MKRLLPALFLALCASSAMAQPASHVPAAADVVKITTPNGSYDNALFYTESGWTFGTIPTVTGTGTPTIVLGSTDSAGEVTGGASATSVVITFSTVKTNAPFCVVTPQTHNSSFDYAVTGTAITVTQTAASGTKIDYMCLQH